MTASRIRRRPRRRQRQAPATTRQHLPLSRVAIILPLLAFFIALAAQAILKAAGLESEHPLRVFLTPALAAAVVFFGLRRYPRASRLRLAAMVAAGLFLFALLT